MSTSERPSDAAEETSTSTTDSSAVDTQSATQEVVSPDSATDESAVNEASQDSNTDDSQQMDGEPVADPIADLTNQLAEANAAVQENKDEFLRAKAETDNVRRRAERDVANARKFALEKFATELLAVVDSLEMGLAAARGDQSAAIEAGNTDENPAAIKVIEGVELTLKMLTNSLEKFGVTAVDPMNQPFDPASQEAVSMVERDDVEANTVVAVMQKGYCLNDRVIRPAMVMVSRKA